MGNTGGDKMTSKDKQMSLPEGVYHVEITERELVRGADDSFGRPKPSRLKMWTTILEGPMKGRKVYAGLAFPQDMRDWRKLRLFWIVFMRSLGYTPADWDVIQWKQHWHAIKEVESILVGKRGYLYYKSDHPMAGCITVRWVTEADYRGGQKEKEKKKVSPLRARPCTLKQAKEVVAEIHRHHKPPTGHRFSIKAERWEEESQEWVLCRVVVVGRPVARAIDQYNVCEVTRLATDGTHNACSFLYARAARAAQAMGFDFIQTYILEEESGASLRAVAWTCDGVVRKDGKGWNNRAGRRTDQPVSAKVRYRKHFNS